MSTKGFVPPLDIQLLKIAEGCDNGTYCVIPSIRGNYRSHKVEDILDEARKMALGRS